MGLRLLSDNLVSLLTVIGIIGGLFFSGLAHFSDARSRRVTNQISLVNGHRDIWKEYLRNPRLSRVLDPGADTGAGPVTREEEILVNMVIQHLSAVFYAMRDDLTIKPEGLRRDVWWFFSLPIPGTVWDRVKVLQNDKFVAFVEAARNWK